MSIILGSFGRLNRQILGSGGQFCSASEGDNLLAEESSGFVGTIWLRFVKSAIFFEQVRLPVTAAKLHRAGLGLFSINWLR
jgi:hypothetical protein